MMVFSLFSRSSTHPSICKLTGPQRQRPRAPAPPLAQRAASEAAGPFLDAEVKGNLVVLSSGAAVPYDIAEDILNAERSGREARDEFIIDRLGKK